MIGILHHKQLFVMYYIYALKCEELVLYVGQTVNMRRRFYAHKEREKTCGSREIPKDMDFYMDILEIVDTIEEAKQREQFFFDTLKPFYNKQRPGQTQKEFKEKWKKRNKEYNKEYYKANKEKLIEYNKEYMKEYRRRNKFD